MKRNRFCPDCGHAWTLHEAVRTVWMGGIKTGGPEKIGCCAKSEPEAKRDTCGCRRRHPRRKKAKP
jgi:hypothetical protein